MSVAIPSDLVAGVMQAAAPERVKTATLRLANAAAATGVSQTGFFAQFLARAAGEVRPHDLPGDLVADVMNAADPVKLAAAEQRLSDGAASGARMAAAAPPDAYQKFEAFMLRNAFEEMLPSPENGVYGEGFAGGVWRSMMADQFASIFADRGGIGIADMLRGKEGGAATTKTHGGNVEPAAQWPYFEAAPISAYQT